MLTDQVNVGLAFLAGLASFLAPCVLPLVPAYLSFLSGYTFTDNTDENVASDHHLVIRWSVVGHALFFVLGFSVVFILLGTAVGALGQLVRGDWLRYVGGILMLLFGLTLIGALHIPLFDREARLSVGRHAEWGYVSSLLMGFAFAAGWTPCVGPVLSTILVLSADQATLGRGVGLLAAYSAGLGIPFLLAALLIDRVGTLTRRLRRYQPAIQMITGILITLVGVILLTDNFVAIGVWFEERGIGWELGI